MRALACDDKGGYMWNLVEGRPIFFFRVAVGLCGRPRSVDRRRFLIPVQALTTLLSVGVGEERLLPP